MEYNDLVISNCFSLPFCRIGLMLPCCTDLQCIHLIDNVKIDRKKVFRYLGIVFGITFGGSIWPVHTTWKVQLGGEGGSSVRAVTPDTESIALCLDLINRAAFSSCGV